MSETSVNLSSSHRYEKKFLVILTVLPKAVIIKLKFLKEMHTVTKISEDSETVFYIYFLICNKTKNKQLPISKLLALNFSFCPFTPTIDKEPNKNVTSPQSSEAVTERVLLIIPKFSIF